MSTPKKYSINHKLSKDYNYDNLSKIYGATVLANAGIFGDEDIKHGSTITFSNLNEDEIKTIKAKH